MTATVVEPKAGNEASVVRREVKGARVADPAGAGRMVSAAVGGLMATGMWIAMFTVGLAVPSQPFRDGLLALAGGEGAEGAFRVEGAADAVYALVIVAFCYTPTNLAMLCCLAALVGCLAYTASNGSEVERACEKGEETLLVSTDAGGAGSAVHLAKGGAGVKSEGVATALRPAICAVTWGFFIYLFLISGMMLAVETPFSSTSPDQYLRLAGTASLLAFVVGWRPELLTHLVSQVGRARITGSSESAKR